MRRIRVHKLGRVEYADGLELMRRAAEQVRARDPDADWLFLLEHPPVLTLGRGADGANVVASRDWLESRGFEVHETDRGGDVTYHGPGQLVAYPVVDLSSRPDVRRFVSSLEEAMIRACADQGIVAGRHPEHRGAWVETRKIGAVGVHLSRWISTHGLAFNVEADLSHFQAIVPCGISDPSLGVTTLRAEVGRAGRPAPSISEVEERLAVHLCDTLEREREDASFDLRTISVTATRADGRVLLLRRSEERGGFWQQVTGRIEPSEKPEEAAVRELREETGASGPVRPLGYVHGFALGSGLAARAGGGLRTGQETAYSAVLPDDFEPRLSEEHREWGWFTPEEALELVPWAGLRQAIRMASHLLPGELRGSFPAVQLPGE
ncbi:MAG: lipoyl(octanoyl) transferase LipB [Deltaproteobacteria bacterium]